MPWSDRRDFGVWPAPSPKPRPVAAACSATDLRVRHVGRDGAGGKTFLFISIIKKTAGRCSLVGYPTMTGLDESGARAAIPVGHDRSLLDFTESPATLDWGETAQVTITSGQSNCERAQGVAQIEPVTWTDLIIVPRGSSGLRVGRDVATVCGLSVSRFARDNAPIEPVARWDSVSATVNLPDQVLAGGLLTYVVTLRNGGAEAVDLAPCGGYLQQLAFQDMNGNDFAKPVYEKYRLNCDTDPMLPAAATREYVMQLQVPESAPATTEARLTWQLDDTSPDQSGQAFIEIVR